MKKPLLYGAIGFFLVYLTGCFDNTSFNTYNWTQTSRTICSILGLLLFIIGVVFGVYQNIEKDIQRTADPNHNLHIWTETTTERPKFPERKDK